MDVSNEVAAIERAATEATGLDDFGDRGFEGSLAAWVTDLQQPRIGEFGRSFLRRLAVRDVARRLRVLAHLREHPEVLDVEIPPIVFITGPPRSGSTLLHELMSTHPSGRPLLRWELMEPLPPPRPQTYATDPRIAKLQASSEPMRGSLVERMHWVDADRPDENTWAFIDGTGMLGRGVGMIMPNWSRWAVEHGYESSFRDFRKVVQLLISEHGPPPGGHLVLKCVMTTESIAAFASVFPEASFVISHRDPFRVLVSSCTLSEAICTPFLDGDAASFRDDELRHRPTLEVLKRTFAALVAFRRAHDGRIVDVRFAGVMDDAVHVLNSTYDEIGMDPDGDVAARVTGFLERQRGGMRAAPPPIVDTFGYDADEVWRDPVVAQYCETFGLERERVRLVDTRTTS